MRRVWVGAAATLLLVTGPTAGAPVETPVPIAAAVQKAYMTFCLPAVLSPPEDAARIAKTDDYSKAELPVFGALKNRTAPAWLAPSDTGRVIVSRGASGVANAETREITVADADSGPLRQAMQDATLCKDCPFVRNTALPSEQAGLKIDKYDWKVDPHTFVSVLAIALPDSSRGASFFVQTHMLHAP